MAIITGSDLDDVINGGDSSDIVRGEAGNDTLIGGNGGDTIFGGRGADRLDGGAGSDILFGEDGNDDINGGEGNDIVDGGNGADVIRVGNGADIANGGAGADRVFADDDGFADILDGGAGFDTLDFSEVGSAVVVDLAAGRATINGVPDVARGFEAVVGSNFNDTITGNSAANTLDGGLGVDTLTGGGGRDTFAFEKGDGGDLISDFSISNDRFALDIETFGLEAGSVVAFQNVARDGEGTEAGLVDVQGGNNVYVLQGGFQNAGQAADALAGALTDNGIDEGAGFFVYFNVNQQRARLFAVDDLDNVDSAIALVANLGNDDGSQAGAVDLLPTFEADNFALV